MTTKDLDHTLNTNYFDTVRLTEKLLPILTEKVVFISSTSTTFIDLIRIYDLDLKMRISLLMRLTPWLKNLGKALRIKPGKRMVGLIHIMQYLSRVLVPIVYVFR